jgi:hypothetical protein
VRLSLVHIPIHLYSYYIGPILRLLIPSDTFSPLNVPFLNISVNPIEASVILPTVLADEILRPLDATITNDSESNGRMIIAPDDYILMFVTGSGSPPAQRVIDLTTPLALAGISIFFITTYFSDYIICPSKSRTAVVAALEARGFELTHESEPTSSASYAHRPPTAGSDGSGSLVAPGTPPPTTLSDLQIRTFAKLQKANVTPTVDNNIQLVHCAGNDDRSIQSRQSLLIAIVKCLLTKPKLFSLTLASGESPSILLETRYLPWFEMVRETNGDYYAQDEEQNASLLFGTSSEILIPIFLDLRPLPLESTGIVCGVAGRLAGGTNNQLGGPIDMSYLSTAQAGCVMVESKDLERAVEVLEQGAKD